MKTMIDVPMTTTERKQAFWLVAVLTLSGWTLWSGVLMYFGWVEVRALGAAQIVGPLLMAVGCSLPLLCPESWGRAALKI